MRTPTEIFEEVLDAWDHRERSVLRVVHEQLEPSLREDIAHEGAMSAHLARTSAYRKEFQGALASWGPLSSGGACGPFELTASPDEAFNGAESPFLHYGDPLGRLVECSQEDAEAAMARGLPAVPGELRDLANSMRKVNERRAKDDGPGGDHETVAERGERMADKVTRLDGRAR